MRRRSALQLLASLPTAMSACAAGPAVHLKPLKADDFRLSRQRGVGYGSLRFGPKRAPDLDALQDLGVGHARIFIEAERAEGSETYAVSDVQWSTLDAVVDSLASRGIYTVLVMGLGLDARDALWKSQALQASAVDLWRTIARRLKDRTAVGAFDLVNEPVPPGFTFGIREERWLAFAAQLIEAIRAVDSKRVIIVESAPDATGESFANMKPLSYSELVYSVHSYFPFRFTHQTVATEHPHLLAWPAADKPEAPLRLELAASLKPVQRFASRYDVPIYVGEFSVPRWAPGASAAGYIAESIALFEQNGWSWAYHEYRGWHGWDAEMEGATKEPQPRSADAPVIGILRRAMRGPRG